MRRFRAVGFAFAFGFSAAAAGALPAQQDPTKEIQELAKKVDAKLD